MAKQTRTFGVALFAAAFAIFSTAGQATVIGSTSNNPYTFSWSYDTGSSLLTGSGSMTISGFNSSLLNVVISLTNTSAIGGQGGERLTAFAFGIDPNATSIGFSDGNDGGMVKANWASGALPANVQGVEVCAFGGVNCSGGANGGIFAGTSDTFSVLLGGTWGDRVDIDPIGLRYQTGYGSFTFPANTVPEPASIALLGVSLLGLGLARRRKIAG